MTTIIEDNELNTELQELYIVSKRWLSDLDFLDSELDFLKKRFKAFDLDVNCADLEEVDQIEKSHAALKTQIVSYLSKLDPLIKLDKQFLDLNIIETYAQIKAELDRSAEEIQSVKHAVLELTKKEIKKQYNEQSI